MGNELKPYNLETSEPIYRISCEECGIIADVGIEPDEVIHTAEQLGFVAVQTEEDGTLNFCKGCRPKATESADTTREALVKALRHYADRENWNGREGGDQFAYCAGGHGFTIADEALKAIGAEEGKDARS